MAIYMRQFMIVFLLRPKWTSSSRVSARKKIMGGGTIRKHKFAKKKGDLSSEHFLEGLH